MRRALIRAMILAGVFFAHAPAKADFAPSLTVEPTGSFTLLEGASKADGVTHVIHSIPSPGAAIDLAIPLASGQWTPHFAFSSREVRYYGSNGEDIEASPAYYNSYEVGVEALILGSWSASGEVAYGEQIFLRSPSSSEILVDKVLVPQASLSTRLGVVREGPVLVNVGAKVFAYFPASTADYSARLGYGYEPVLTGTHEFSKMLSVSAEASYLKRVQDSSVFTLTEQDFELALGATFAF